MISGLLGKKFVVLIKLCKRWLFNDVFNVYTNRHLKFSLEWLKYVVLYLQII